MAPKLFIIGIGFIGGTVLNRLVTGKRKGEYDIYALTRKDDQAPKLKELGVIPVKGTLDDHDVIKEQTTKSDVVIHAATADHLPSVQAILDGIEARPDKSKRIIYIHTSGTGVLCQDDRGKPSDYVHDDAKPEAIDQKLPDSNDHRAIDLTIKKFRDTNRGGDGARIQIMAPPCIYGLGEGPFNKTSIQVPLTVQLAASSGWEYVGYVNEGRNIWGNVHISNLADGYEILLDYLNSPNPDISKAYYVFTEQGEHDWHDLAVHIAKALVAKGKMKSPTVHSWEGKEWEAIEKGGGVAGFGGNSRGKANRLRALGWEPRIKTTLYESVPEEMDATLQRLGF